MTASNTPEPPFVIDAVTHVGLRVRDLAGAIRTATEIMGLQVTEEADDRVYLSHGTPHHSLVYIAADEDALDHIGLLARNDAALGEIRERLHREGHPIISDHPLSAGIAEGFAFEGPEGFVFEVYRGMREVAGSYAARGVRPNRFGHVNLSPRDPAPMRRLLECVLDFRVSDALAGGWFMRCNADHHGIGVLPGHGVLHHHAWEVQSLIQLGELADRVHEMGESVLWGPGRHAIGRNIATYFEDTCGVVVEYYTDMVRIYDEASHEPTSWSTDGHKWFSLWEPFVPDGFTERGVRPAARCARSA
jgi:catechol-2,3-dioxygenase